jgi:hypothetical protein
LFYGQMRGRQGSGHFGPLLPVWHTEPVKGYPALNTHNDKNQQDECRH